MPFTHESSNSPAGHPVALPWSDDHEDLVIGRRFDQVAGAMGDVPALCLDEQTWTYRELADAAGRVAGFLHRIRPEGRVLLYLGNSFHHFAAAFGAWRAGWVTIPMDPRYPSNRNRQILQDADPDLVLTDPEHRDELLSFCDLTIEARAMDQYEPVSQPDSQAIGKEIRPDTPTAILFTSGSTGRPKGVLHTHASLMHMTKRRSQLARAGPSDAFTLFYSASVMGGLSIVLYGFLNGGSLHPRDIRNDGFSDLEAWLRRHRITCCHSVTSLYREYTRHLGPGRSFPDLRLIILGGEQAYPADIELGWEVFGPSVEFSCGIGSTEINTARQIPVPPGCKLPADRMPFGFPVEGVEVIILDQDQKPVPAGEFGEIAIRSMYLSLGYWRRPEETRERFIPDPTGGNLTVYLTGDLGRIDAKGCLHGAGRNDHQIKIRGFRVEPGEINTHLMAQPGIREACTIAVRSESGTLSLAAFYVTASDAKITTADLHRALSAEMPDYMVPTRLIELKSLPRTPNGKIDQAALALPEQAPIPAERQPETPTEQRLAYIWSAVLETDSVAVDMGFFDLGGTSLSAIALLARIERKMHRQLPVSILFEHSTIRDLAAHLDRGSTRTGHSGLVPIRPEGSGEPLYIIGGMTGEVFFCRRLLAHLQTKRPVFALEPDTLSGGRTRFSRIEEVAGDYAQAILTHQPTGPFTIAGYSFGGTVAFELARQLAALGHEVSRTIIFDSVAPERRVIKRISDADQQISEGDEPGTSIREKPPRLRFLRPGWWLRSKGDWRRSYWRLKYVRLYELLLRFHYSPPISWRRCYAYWATHWMGQRYRAGPYDGPTVLFRSEARREQGETGWGELCGDKLQLIFVPGDHGSIFTEPDVRHLAHETDKVLDG